MLKLMKTHGPFTVKYAIYDKKLKPQLHYLPLHQILPPLLQPPLHQIHVALQHLSDVVPHHLIVADCHPIPRLLPHPMLPPALHSLHLIGLKNKLIKKNLIQIRYPKYLSKRTGAFSSYPMWSALLTSHWTQRIQFKILLLTIRHSMVLLPNIWKILLPFTFHLMVWGQIMCVSRATWSPFPPETQLTVSGLLLLLPQHFGMLFPLAFAIQPLLLNSKHAERHTYKVAFQV